jgi:hypothetical protein
MYSDSTIHASQSTATSELLTQTPDNTIAFGEGSLAPVRAMLEPERDWLTQTQVCGGKCSELSSKQDPALLLSRIQKACSSEEVEKYLPLCSWRDIVAKTRSCYRQRKSELATKETASSSLLSFRTLHSSNTSTNSKPAGLTKCEQSLRKLGIISPSHYLSARGMELIFGFPQGWTDCLSRQTSLSATWESKAKPKVELEPDTYSLKQSCQDKLTLPSNECSSWQKSSALSISSRPAPGLSGLTISFGKTLPYLPHKTVTRRSWKDSHAKKFTNAFNQNKLVQAFDKDRRRGGKQIGWCRLKSAPYKEQILAMPEADLAAEGGMCDSVEQFIKHYFKGNSSLEVWVIRFEFIAVDALGVYSNSANKADSNSAITTPTESIHQVLLSTFNVCSTALSKTDSYSAITAPSESIHQASIAPLGVYSGDGDRTDANSAVTSLNESIHQTSVENLGVYSNLASKTDNNAAITSPTESIHQVQSDDFGVYSTAVSKSDSNYSFGFPTDSIHQAAIETLGVYSSAIGNKLSLYGSCQGGLRRCFKEISIRASLSIGERCNN